MTRPVTTSGRFIRLGTASMQSEPGGAFININKVNVQKYAERPAMCKALCDYMLHVEHAPKRAAELAAAATTFAKFKGSGVGALCDYMLHVEHAPQRVAGLAAAATTFAKFKDWWWKARLGKAYYQMGLLRDSEQQLLSSIKEQPMVTTYLQLANIYLRLDQPNKALETLAKGSARFGHDVSLLLAQARVHDAVNAADKAVTVYKQARVHDAVNAADKAVTVYKQVLSLDASNVESVACLASFQFYSDQPEVALRYYRRLLQMGVLQFYFNQPEVALRYYRRLLQMGCDTPALWSNLGLCCFGAGQCDTPALWSNLGLCCFGAGQYDMCLTCFDKALQYDMCLTCFDKALQGYLGHKKLPPP
ncbi:hypothetical protein T484DRAFT_1811718 [Baffinella frigidus]|nr:hypothetical protein T484DRAFT_1811718 [Cryptophyta sp. CCMP2293]